MRKKSPGGTGKSYDDQEVNTIIFSHELNLQKVFEL